MNNAAHTHSVSGLFCTEKNLAYESHVCNLWLQVRSGQVVIQKARPAMDAAVMFLNLSLSPTSSSSLTRFRPVVMPYNDKPALFRSFSILSIHRCFGRPTGRFPTGFQLWSMDGHLSLFILEILAVGPSKDGLVLSAIMTAISIIYLII